MWIPGSVSSIVISRIKETLGRYGERYARVLRFLVSGGSAASVNLVVLFVAVTEFGMWYIAGAVVSFFVSFIVSFLMQKFWTFRDSSIIDTKEQLVEYLSVALINLCLGTTSLYVLVEYGGLHYMFAQFLTMGAVAVLSYFVYKHLIFHQKSDNKRPIGNMAPVRVGKMALSTRRGRVLIVICFFALVSLVATVVPYAIVRYHAGSQWMGVTPHLSEDAMRYFARAHNVSQGNLFPTNPYFYEHREEPSPTPSVNDFLVVVPQILGLSFNSSYYLNIFVWGMLFLILAFSVLREIGVGYFLSLFGSIFAYLGVYGDMLRPGAMQVVFPLYLAFLLQYGKFSGRGYRSVALLGVFAGITAHSYIYLFMVVLATMGASFLLSAVNRDRNGCKRMMYSGIIAIAVALPHFVHVILLSAQSYYEETIVRIVLAASHVPQIEAYYYGRWFVIVLIIVALLRRYVPEKLNKNEFIFIFTTGIGIFIAMLSNVFTGKDFDVAVHVARFGILWYLLVLVYLVRPAASLIFLQKGRFVLRGVVVFLISLMVLQSGLNLNRTIEPLRIKKEDIVRTQTYANVLDWLSRKPSAVIIAPEGISSYIPILTNHYLLFSTQAGLFRISDEEFRERFLLQHAFDGLTGEEFLKLRPKYDGPTADVLAKGSNLKYFICTTLLSDDHCTPPKREEDFVPTEKILSQFRYYYPLVRENLAREYKKYHVRYILAGSDKSLSPEQSRLCDMVYRDEWFSVCEVILDISESSPSAAL
jgi:putative flippase GtrA